MRFLKLTTALMMAFSCFCFAGCDDGAAPAETPAVEAPAEEGSGEKAEEGSGEKAEEGSDAKKAGSDAK